MPRKLDIKIVDKFLFFPMTIKTSKGKKQTKFFEKVRIEFVYDIKILKDFKTKGKWIPTRFMDV